MTLTWQSLTDKSAPYQVWCPWVFSESRYNAFNLSRDLTWPSHWRVVQLYRQKSLQYVTTLINLVTTSILIMETCFSFDMQPLVKTCLKGYMNLWMEVSHTESPSCHFGGYWSIINGGRKYLIYHKTMQISDQVLYGWELFMVCCNLAKFGGNRCCSRREMFLVCHLIKQNHVIIGSDDCNYEKHSW